MPPKYDHSYKFVVALTDEIYKKFCSSNYVNFTCQLRLFYANNKKRCCVNQKHVRELFVAMVLMEDIRFWGRKKILLRAIKTIITLRNNEFKSTNNEKGDAHLLQIYYWENVRNAILANSDALESLPVHFANCNVSLPDQWVQFASCVRRIVKYTCNRNKVC
jgi:hypothetical protein